MAKETGYKQFKPTKMVLGPGIASYPWLNKPDTKFNDAGVYKVDLLVSGEEGEALIEKLDAFHAENLATMKAEVGRKKLKLSSPQWKPAEDDEGEEIAGQWVVRTKMKASYIDRKTKKTVHLKPFLCDAQRQPITARIGGGSTLKVSVNATPWYNTSQGFGVKLNIRGVQVLDLQEFGAGASDFDDEDGYVAPAAQTDGANDNGEDDGDEGDF